MSSSPSPKYSLTIHPYREFISYREEQLDYALSLCSNHYPCGLAHLLLPLEAWRKLPGHTYQDADGLTH